MKNGMTNDSFAELYEKQVDFQNKIIKKHPYDVSLDKDVSLPADIPQLMSYHVQGLVCEIGEVLAADKRWKNYRNGHLDVENKKEEIADCFLFLMNIAIFSGMNSKDVFDTIKDKIVENEERVEGL